MDEVKALNFCLFFYYFKPVLTPEFSYISFISAFPTTHRDFNWVTRKYGDKIGLKGCPDPLSHERLFFSVKFLILHNIPFNVTIQNPGELVLAMPDLVHCGFNLGTNLATNGYQSSSRKNQGEDDIRFVIVKTDYKQ